MKRLLMWVGLLLAGAGLFYVAVNDYSPQKEEVTFYTYKVVQEYPHDPQAFTQGLVFQDSVLYEGTGLYGQSSLRKVDLETGTVYQMYQLPSQYFGEGITICHEKIIQLTWRAGTGFVYDKDQFTLISQFTYSSEGWGITYDGNKLIMSDGTSTLHFLDPETFSEIGTIEVTDNGEPVTRLNELEYIEGQIYANVWLTDRIVRLDPDTGKVTGWINLEGLLDRKTYSQADVLNGIAFDQREDRMFVTGKLWPTLFEIELVPVESIPVEADAEDFLQDQLVNSKTHSFIRGQQLIAVARTGSEWRSQWTLRLLREETIKKGIASEISTKPLESFGRVQFKIREKVRHKFSLLSYKTRGSLY